MGRVKVKLKRLRKEVKLPRFKYPEDAGFDLSANLNFEALLNLNHRTVDDIPLFLGDYGPFLKLNPLERIIVPTGLKVEFEESLNNKVVMRIYPRSGVSINLGLTLINSVGIIDQNYRGEIGVPVVNLSNEELIIMDGQRIAQAIVEEIPFIEIKEVKELSKTNRGEGGFGSTGI